MAGRAGTGARPRPRRLRRRRGVDGGGGEATSTPAADVEKFDAGDAARRHPGEGRDRDRRQVRRAALRLQQPVLGQGRGLRRRPRPGGRRQARREAEVHRGDLRQPDPVPGGRDRRPDPLDDDDQRGARRADRVLRPVLHRQGPDPRQEGQLRDHRRRHARRQERLHRARLDLRGDAQEAGARRQAQARRLLLGVPGVAAERQRRRDLHRRRDPDRHDHPGRLAQARRRRAQPGALRRRHQEGQHGAAGVRQRRLPGVQGRRPLRQDLREVGRPVHRHGRRGRRRSRWTRRSSWSSRTRDRSSRACPSPSSTR